MARERPRPAPHDEAAPDLQPPAEWWDSVLADPRAAGKPWLTISQRRLNEIPREILRVDCLRCGQTVEIQRPDAIKLFGPHEIYRRVAQRLLDDTCRYRSERLEEDGCWPEWFE